MKDNAPEDSVVDRLRHAVEGAVLPKAARGHAAHLIQRLSSPVRLTLLGPPGAGKSELVNMFLGRSLIEAGLKLPTMEVAWGDREEIEVTSMNGAVSTQPGLDLKSAAATRPAFLKVTLPVPILKKLSLLEVVTNGGADELRSAVDWAVRRTDITLWCTQTFDAEERALWSRVPDGLKDHAFLVLSKADVLSAQKALTDRIADLETVVAEEFHSLFAVATLQGIKAQSRPGGLDEAMYHGSGGSALTSEILRHAERGRRADLDSAQLFLARYNVGPVPMVAPPQVKPDTAPEPKPEPAPAPTVAEIALPSAHPPIDPDLFVGATRFLKRRAEALAGKIEDAVEGDTREVLEECSEAVEHLIDMFSNDDSGCPVADEFLDDLNEASEIMVLMQIEPGDGPAADAATLLLQLRREMEMKLAA